MKSHKMQPYSVQVFLKYGGNHGDHKSEYWDQDANWHLDRLWLYLRASEKAGALWSVCEERATQGYGMVKRSENFQNVISAIDAGFRNPRDATSCERISELHEEDWRTYEEETKKEMRQATMNGLENIWRASGCILISD